MNEIKNYDFYNNEMKKALYDKAWFIDKIPEGIDTVLDFGCADGSLIKFLANMFDGYNYIGYDYNTNMIDKAKELLGNNSDVFVSSSQEEISEYVEPRSTVLNISSVIHEIYNYCTIEEIDAFWDYVFNSGFEYISIRDMCLSKNATRYSNRIDCAKVYRIRSTQLTDFEKEFGLITDNKNLIHFLCKYRYILNWDREVQEDYFPLDYEDLMKLIPETYEIVYADHFTLPFLRRKVQADIGITINDPTHVKLLLKRK